MRKERILSHTRMAGGLLALAMIAAASLAFSGVAGAATNPIRFYRSATANFDAYTCAQPDGTSCSTPEEQQWMRDHYWRIRGFTPWFDSSNGPNSAISWGLPSDVYTELYAIYRESNVGVPNLGTLSRHPTWVLRDRADVPSTSAIEGRRLYLPWFCDDPKPGCPEFAADIGNQYFRNWWINRMRDVMSHGYTGIYVDDVNLDWRIADGSGRYIKPWDPRTKKRMTLDHWRKYVATFTEQIRAAFPDALIIHNGFFWQNRDNPWVQRETAAADFLELERGFNDAGLTAGRSTDRFALRHLLAYIDWLHKLGKSVILEPHFNTPTMSGATPTPAVMSARREQEIAGYFLIRARRDAIVADFQSDPPRTGGTNNWSPMWETDMGSALAARYEWQPGLLRRNFENGFVLENMPERPQRVITLPHTYYRFDNPTQCWKPVTSVTLRRTPLPWQTPLTAAEEATSQGAVLLNAAPPQDVSCAAP